MFAWCCIALCLADCRREPPRADGARLPVGSLETDETTVDVEAGDAAVEASAAIDEPEDASQPEPPRPPRSLGTLWNTYYIVADEEDFSGPRNTDLYDEDCRPITKVRRSFYNSLCIQGSGLLSDDRVVNFGKHCTRTCRKARVCRRFPVRICYKVLDPERYPWGMGKAPRPLVPDWSIAVDPDLVPLDSIVYLEELDGLVPPGKTVPHDGCVGAVDTGGRIDDDHIDIFAGTRRRWLAWEKLLPTKSRLKGWLDHPRCAEYRPGPDGDITNPERLRDNSRLER